MTDTCDSDERGDMRAIAVSHRINTSHQQSSETMRNQEERAKIAGSHWLRFASGKFDTLIETNHAVISSNLRIYKILSSFGGQQPIAVYRITDFPFERELIALKSLPADREGWFEFDITLATQRWVGMDGVRALFRETCSH